MSIAINLMERENESRKVLWALLIAVILHLVVAFFLAAFSSRLYAPLPDVEDRPTELTLMDNPIQVPVSKPNPQFMETDESKASAQAPKEKTFESNANSLAASQLPETGESALPTQDGKNRPFVDLETQSDSLGPANKPVQMQPTPAPAAMPTPAAPEVQKTVATPAPAATPEPDQLAMLTSTPPPAIQAPEETQPAATPQTEVAAPPARPKPEQPASAYRAYKEQTRISGRITNRGPSSVDATETPLGRYKKAITDSIGSRWLYYVKKEADLISIGTTHVTFYIDRDGHVDNLKMNGNTANEAFANVCLRSIQEAKLPPEPGEVVDVLPSEGLLMDVSFTYFSRQ